jgi:uncharacterized protein YgfB (UPF0149 family)
VVNYIIGADMIQPDYARVQQLLAQERALADAAEAHGTLAGCLCGASGYRFEDWLREILPDGKASPAAGKELRELYEGTAAALLQPDMQLMLVLPPDEEPLPVRTIALAEWCQGFLYGLGAGGIPDPTRLRADVGGEEDEESNENAYGQLVEFVRVGVQLLFEELGAARQGAPAGAAALH